MDEIILNKTFFLIPDSLEDVNYVTLYEKKGADRININELIAQKFLEKTIARLPSFEVIYICDVFNKFPSLNYHQFRKMLLWMPLYHHVLNLVIYIYN